MLTKTTIKKLVKEEINALGLEETLIAINFDSEKLPQGFLLNIKHEGFKNIFTYLEHELKELTKDIKEDIKGWKIDFAPFL